MRDAGDRRLAERRAEEGHAPRHDKVAHAAEHRREHQDAEEPADEERVLKVARQDAARGEVGEPAVERGHARTARRPSGAGISSRTCADASTSRRAVRDARGDRGRSRDRRGGAPARDRATPSGSSCARCGGAAAGCPRTSPARSRRGPLPGSSSTSSSGSGSSACASSTRRSSPPERTASGRPLQARQTDAPEQARRRVAARAREAQAHRAPLARQRQEVADRDGQRRVDGEVLRDVADGAVRRASSAGCRPANAICPARPRPACSCRRRSVRRARGCCRGATRIATSSSSVSPSRRTTSRSISSRTSAAAELAHASSTSARIIVSTFAAFPSRTCRRCTRPTRCG